MLGMSCIFRVHCILHVLSWDHLHHEICAASMNGRLARNGEPLMSSFHMDCVRIFKARCTAALCSAGLKLLWHRPSPFMFCLSDEIFRWPPVRRPHELRRVLWKGILIPTVAAALASWERSCSIAAAAAIEAAFLCLQLRLLVQIRACLQH